MHNDLNLESMDYLLDEGIASMNLIVAIEWKWRNYFWNLEKI